MKSAVFKIALLCTLGLGWFLVTPVSAQQPTPSDDQVNAVAHELYCPVCENIPLDVCPTQACAQWRDLIRTKLEAGWSKPQIEAYFASQYGDRVLAVPPFQRTFNQVLPALIGIGILTGVGLVFWTLRGSLRSVVRKTPRETPSSTPPTVDEEYLQRIEKDLRRRS